MKKLVLKTTIAAVATAFAGSAFAIVDLSSGAGVVKFANELTYNNATPLVGNGTQMDAGGTLGFGVSTGATRYIRIAFGNATLDGAAGPLVVAGADLGTIVQGGAAGDNFVIYQFTATANRTAADSVFIGQAAGYRVTTAGSPITATYTLHETAVDATAGTNSLFTQGPVSIATFAPGLAYSVTPNTSIASVADGFKKFCTSAACTATTFTVPLGAVSYGTDGAVFNGYTGAAVALADLVTAATKITATGDFGAAVALYLDANDACATPVVAGALNTGKTAADFAVGTTSFTPANVCFVVNGTTVLQAQTVNQVLDVTANTAGGSTAADTASAVLGTIIRNGASTTALNITDPANGDQTFLRISNMGTVAGKVTGTLFAQDGTQLGAADVVLVASAAAKSTTVLSAADLAAKFGVTGWAGRAKLVVIGEFPAGQLRVQNLIRTPNGTLTNVGGDTSGNGN